MQQLEHLRKRLLDGGVAPRHVRRTLTELRDHYDDALRDEELRGLMGESAKQAAQARMGDSDVIAQSIIARPELQSLAAKHPRLIFGAAPILLWIAGMLLMVVTFVATIATADKTGWLPTHGPELGVRIGGAVNAACIFANWVLPVLLEMFLIYMAARQRLALRWPLIGAAIIALVTGTTTIFVIFSSTMGEPNKLIITSSLLPFLLPFTNAVGNMDTSLLARGVLRSIVMVAIMLAPYPLRMWRQKKTV